MRRPPRVVLYCDMPEDLGKLEGFVLGRQWRIAHQYDPPRRAAFLSDLQRVGSACCRFDGAWWIGATDLAQLSSLISEFPQTTARAVITAPDDQSYLTLRQTARIAQCSTLTLYRACWAGKLKYGRMNRNIRVTRAWLDQWMLGRIVR